MVVSNVLDTSIRLRNEQDPIYCDVGPDCKNIETIRSVGVGDLISLHNGVGTDEPDSGGQH